MSLDYRSIAASLGRMTFSEFRRAARRLRQQRIFALGVIAVLALAIGANTAVFTLVNAILLRPLPLRAPDRLITLATVRPGTDRQPISLPGLADFETAQRTIAGAASFFGWSVNLTGTGEAERLSGMRVSANYFELTGAQVPLGRAIQREDEHRPVALIGHGLWQRRFGGATDVIGRAVVLNGDAFTIIGVLGRDFVTLVRDAEVVAPYSAATDPRRANRAQGFLRVVLRLNNGATLAQARDELGAILERLRRQYPDAHGADTGVRVTALHEEVTGRSAPMLRILLAAVTLMLLVACANIANLFLVRGSARRRELALRTALGASRARIMGQLLAEASILGLIGGALGLLAARAMVEGLLAVGPTDLPRAAEVAIDLRAALFTLAVSFGASLLFGIVPALHATCGDLRDGLSAGDRGSGGGGNRVRAGLIFLEVALSAVLLLTAVLLARSFQRVQDVDPGFRPASVLTVRLSLPRARYQSGAAIANFYNLVEPRIAALPGVRAVAAANVVPMNGYLATTAFHVDGVIVTDAPQAHYRMISDGYFRALGIGVLKGRSFGRADHGASVPVVIVNETLERQYLGGNAVGRRLRLGDGEKTPREVEVVGVVGNVKHFGLERETTVELYVPLSQVPDPTTIWLANNMYWVVLTDGVPLAAANAVRREIAAVDPSVPASFVRSMDQWLAGTIAPRRFNLLLVEAFAIAALLLTAVGVYAVSASAVAARTREIGIRTALGATRWAAVALVLRGTLSPALAGLAVGIAVALLSGRTLSGLLFGVSSTDPVSLVIVAVILASTSLLASYFPARRAAEVDPLIALRTE